MAKVLEILYTSYHDLMTEYADPRSENMSLAQSPFIPLGLIGIYFLLVTRLVPHLMEKRSPLAMDKVIILYNFLQIVLSARFFYLGITSFYLFGPYKFRCEPVDWSDSPLGLLAVREAHHYYLLKIVDLLDTVFFVLRKKQRQVTFLHLWHHSSMVLISWIGLRFSPGGQAVFIGVLNSFVHVVMYLYYLMTLFNRSTPIWWKRYITILQIVQFGMIAVQWAVMLIGPSCGFPKLWGILVFPHNTFFAVMFLDFYLKAYVKKNKI